MKLLNVGDGYILVKNDGMKIGTFVKRTMYKFEKTRYDSIEDVIKYHVMEWDGLGVGGPNVLQSLMYGQVIEEIIVWVFVPEWIQVADEQGNEKRVFVGDLPPFEAIQ